MYPPLSQPNPAIEHGRLSGAEAVCTTAADRLVLWMLVLPILGATFFSKFALPDVKAEGIGMGFPLLYLALAAGACVAGIVRVEPARLIFYCLMASIIGGVAVLQGENISLPSLAFLILLHLPYVVYMAGAERVMKTLFAIFLNVALFIALCGIGQYVLQFFVAPAYVFPLENFLPADLLVSGFNMQAPIAYGSSIYRANGIFMQEPSFFSQFLAIAVLVEMLGPARLWRVALCVVAIMASHSGTGLIVLAVCLPILIVARRRWNLVIIAVITLLLLILAAPYLHLDHLIARVGEFGSERSSAYERFVGGFRIFEDSVAADPVRLLFGYGAGSYRDLVHGLNHPAAEMALFKIVVEYGLVGTLLYFGFVLFCLFGARGPFVLRLALVITLFLNGAYNTFVHSLALALLVWPSSSLRRNEEGSSKSPRREFQISDTVVRPSW
jgi:hypothetical protein